MVRFSFYEPTPAVDKNNIAVYNELNESVEVEVNTFTFESQCNDSFVPASYSETSGSMMMSYDSDDRATDNIFSDLEVSGKMSSAYEGKEFNLLSPPTEETAMDSWPSASSLEYQYVFPGLEGSRMKYSADAVNDFNVTRNDTIETVKETMLSLTSYDCQDEGEIEETVSGRSDIDTGSVVTEYLQGGIASLTEDEGPEDEGINDDCIVEIDASSKVQEVKFINATEEGPKVKDIADVYFVAVDYDVESKEPKIKGIADECVVVLDVKVESKNGTENFGECRNVASSGDKLAEMMRDRIQAINGIRGLLEREQEQGKSSHNAEQLICCQHIPSHLFYCNHSAETGVVFELSNEVKILRHDVACKGQANKELMKTVTYLKTKNQDYAQQMSQLSSTIDELVMSKQETIEQKNVLEEDVTAKNVIIDEITVEIDNKNILLEEKTAENDDLAEHLQRSKAENDGLKAAIQDLVAINEENIKQMTILEDDVAVKKSMIDQMSMDIHKWTSTCEEKAAEITELNEQLELYKVESDKLKATAQDLESKNTNYSTELENLVSSIQEVVELNGELQAQVEEVNATNDELDKLNNANEEKSAELLDVVECLTQSLNDVRLNHENEMEEMKNMAETEKENNAAIVRKIEETLEVVTAQMTADMLSQKAFLEGKIANLVQSLDEAMVYRKDVLCQNKELQTKIQGVKTSAARAHEGLAGAIGQLEKDVEEEFQITTQLKNGTEKLVMKLGEDKNSHYVNDVEDLLGNVRMIQCCQLSHFQLINNLVTENKAEVRSIQLL